MMLAVAIAILLLLTGLLLPFVISVCAGQRTPASTGLIVVPNAIGIAGVTGFAAYGIGSLASQRVGAVAGFLVFAVVYLVSVAVLLRRMMGVERAGAWISAAVLWVMQIVVIGVVGISVVWTLLGGIIQG
jgi:hypothetical protein